ncbi:MAG: NADP-dependent oxidoreductase [Myxococcota bacterium]
MSLPSSMRGLVFVPNDPDRVHLRGGLPMPTVKPGEILVQVAFATVNAHEFDTAQLLLTRILLFLRGMRSPVRTGLEFSGVVVSDGETFHRGDRVMGYVDLVGGERPHAEYVAIPEAYLAAVPTEISLAASATLPMSGLTALEALREVSAIQPGQTVLILGASGGVGVLAVQVAKRLGATVTAVASAAHHDRLQALGATHTVDYRQVPISEMSGTFDAILDFSSTKRLREVKHLLASGGGFVPADPVQNISDVLLRSQARYLFVDKGNTQRLNELASWVDEGRLTPVIDRQFALNEWKQAVHRSHERGRMGRVVLSFMTTLP